MSNQLSKKYNVNIPNKSLFTKKIFDINYSATKNVRKQNNTKNLKNFCASLKKTKTKNRTSNIINNKIFNDNQIKFQNCNKKIISNTIEITNTCPNNIQSNKISLKINSEKTNNKNKNKLDTCDLLNYYILKKNYTKLQSSTNNTTKKSILSFDSCLKNTNNKKFSMEILENDKNDFEAKKLVEFLISLAPEEITFNKNNENLLESIKFENNIKQIKNLDININNIINDCNQKLKKLKKSENFKIINIESNMRINIYKNYFDFITKLLEQINRLSYNMANNINNGNKFEIKKFGDKNINAGNEDLFSFISDSFLDSFLEINNDNVNNSISNTTLINTDSNNSFDLKDEICENKEKKNIIKNDIEISFDNKDSKKNLKIFKTKNLYSEKKPQNTLHRKKISAKLNFEDKKCSKIYHQYSSSLKINSNKKKKIIKKLNFINENNKHLKLEEKENNCKIY